MPHEHPHTHDNDSKEIVVLHATAPTCWWSWGYEAVINRLRMVYGDQIRIRTWTSFVYDDFDQHMKHYGMSWKDFLGWTKEGSEIMNIPLELNPKRNFFPKSVLPATIAVFAAKKQGAEKSERLAREFLRMFNVELKDVSKDKIIFEAAETSGLDMKKFKKDFSDKDARLKEMNEEQKTRPHELPIFFYNMIIADNERKYINIDNAFEPKEVEAAIDYLSGGKLKKELIHENDVPKYLKAHGFAPLMEIARVFNMSPERAREVLATLEKQGVAERKMLAGAPHWKAKE